MRRLAAFRLAKPVDVGRSRHAKKTRLKGEFDIVKNYPMVDGIT